VILYDGIFKHFYPELFYAPTTGGSVFKPGGAKPVSRPNACTVEKENNLRIRNARVVIEHFFGRLKVVYPMFAVYTFRNLSHVDDWVMCGIILLNMSLIYDSPLRTHACTDGMCYHCLHL